MTARPTTYATNGVIATPHYLASQAGLRVLQQGGNAVEAAIASNAVLNVVYPHNCHMGGDLFAIVWDPRDGSLAGLNASGPAASGATIERLRGLGLERMPERGVHSITVPGAVAGWSALMERYGSGRFGLDQLLRQAIEYARDGFPISAKLARAIDMLAPTLDDSGIHAALFHRTWQRGDVMRQPAFAATLERVGREGRDGFYRGPVADDIVETLGALGHTLNHDDLAGFQPEWVTPWRTEYRGHELIEMPPNTVGATVLLMMNIIEGLPVTELGHTTPAGVHAWVETTKRAYHERDRRIGDMRFVDVPEERFTSKQDAAEHRAALDLERVTTREAAPSHDGDTIYQCCVDRDGLAVSFIQSLYSGFGSGVLAPKSGVIFQNRGSSFSLEPGHPNALEPGKRPRHTLIPAMLLKDGKPSVVFGNMGGDGQTQFHLQLLLGMIDFGLDPQAAIEVPRWRHITDPAGGQPILRVEPGLGDDTIADLRRRGHDVLPSTDWDEAMGHANIIAIDRERGVLAGGSDPRGDGIAAGW